MGIVKHCPNSVLAVERKRFYFFFKKGVPEKEMAFLSGGEKVDVCGGRGPRRSETQTAAEGFLIESWVLPRRCRAAFQDGLVISV